LGWGGRGFGVYLGSPYYGYSYPSYSYGWSYPSYYGYSWPYTTYDYSVPFYGSTTEYTQPQEYSAGGTYPSAYQSFYPSGDANASREVMASIMLPSADAELWIEGQKMTNTGTVRRFASPPLETGRGYTYNFRARWNQDGQTMDQTRKVRVHAGDRITVDFNQPEEQSGAPTVMPSDRTRDVPPRDREAAPYTPRRDGQATPAPREAQPLPGTPGGPARTPPRTPPPPPSGGRAPSGDTQPPPE
jgi:uncharacterized protein (TIGR03000 family)